MANPKSGLALLLGMPSKGGRSSDSEGPSDVNDSAEGSEDSSDEFEQAATDAFPELADSPERLAAFKQAIMACMDTGYDDSGKT